MINGMLSWYIRWCVIDISKRQNFGYYFQRKFSDENPVTAQENLLYGNQSSCMWISKAKNSLKFLQPIKRRISLPFIDLQRAPSNNLLWPTPIMEAKYKAENKE